MKKFFTSLFILIIALASSGFSILPAQAQGTWTTVYTPPAPLPTPTVSAILTGSQAGAETYLFSIGDALLAASHRYELQSGPGVITMVQITTWYRSSDSGRTWVTFTPQGLPDLDMSMSARFLQFKGAIYAGILYKSSGRPVLYRSTDGMYWSVVNLPISSIFKTNSIFASPTTLYVDVMDTQGQTTLLSSTDGTSWSILKQPSSIPSIPPGYGVYLNNTFYAQSPTTLSDLFFFSSATSYFRSLDGINWSAVSPSGWTPSGFKSEGTGLTIDIGPIAYNNALYVFKRGSPTSPLQVFKSTDGISYSPVNIQSLTGEIKTATVHQGMLYIMAQVPSLMANAAAVYAFDGATWSTSYTPPAPLPPPTVSTVLTGSQAGVKAYLFSIGNSLLAAARRYEIRSGLGGIVPQPITTWYRSSDSGKNWSTFSPQGLPFSELIPDGVQLHILNFKNALYASVSGISTQPSFGLYRSSDGVNWSKVNLPIASQSIDGFFASPTTLYVNVRTDIQGVGGRYVLKYALLTSADGAAWTVVSNQSPASLIPPGETAFLNDVFFAQRPIPSPISLVPVSSAATYDRSSDGLNWAQISPSGWTPAGYQTTGSGLMIDIGPIAYNNALYVFKRGSPTSPLQIFKSTDGVTYVSLLAQNLTGEIKAVTVHQGTLYVLTTVPSALDIAFSATLWPTAPGSGAALYAYNEPPGSPTPMPTSPPPALTFSASPSSVISGQSTTLTWAATNVSSCSASGVWSGNKSVSGSETVTPPIHTLNYTVINTYTLVCVGPGGTASKSVTVEVGVGGSNAIVFKISLQGRTDLTGIPTSITITDLGYGAENTFSGTGDLIILPSTFSPRLSAFRFKASSPYYLSTSLIGFINYGTTIMPPLPAGDLNQDQTINSLDWSLMSPKWFTSDPIADLNKDGSVNSIDFSLLNRNWGKSGG